MTNHKTIVGIFLIATFLLIQNHKVYSQLTYGLQIDSNDILITGRIDLSIDQNNLFIGQNAGVSNNSQSADNIGQNTFLGVNSGIANTIGDLNTFTGYQSGSNNINGTSNTFIGASSGLLNENGEYNTFIGSSSGGQNVSGTDNVYIGRDAGFSSTSDGNVYVGAGTGTFNSNGTGNTFIGKCSGQGSQGSGNVFIGAFSGNNETGDHKLYISNGLNGDGTLIYGDFNSQLIELRGNVNIKEALTLTPVLPPSGTCIENGQLKYGTNDELYICKGGNWKTVLTN